ncbi:hypothetical protein MKQ70_36585 [Chitinophaga sedimenti]|uniref:hypothetical protein n=1 Tax=Chitinophaga sedimenti TaxID=2033606 RepID=UPI00200434F4|nr:hypothetical protein [Chitinophaga sedimenti]MCK7560143.1 hypothetical protein [Chitinophaga sedimenti]
MTLLLRGNINDANVDKTTENWGTDVNFGGGAYSLRTSTRRNTRLQALLTADRKLSRDLNLSVSAGGESQRYQPERFSESATAGGLKVLANFSLVTL